MKIYNNFSSDISKIGINVPGSIILRRFIKEFELTKYINVKSIKIVWKNLLEIIVLNPIFLTR